MPGPAGPSLQTGIHVTLGPSGDSNVDASQTSFLCQDHPGYVCPQLPVLQGTALCQQLQGDSGSTEARGWQSSREIQSTITRGESSAQTGPRNSCFHYSNERERLGACQPFAAREKGLVQPDELDGLWGKNLQEKVLSQPWSVMSVPKTAHRREPCSPVLPRRRDAVVETSLQTDNNTTPFQKSIRASSICCQTAAPAAPGKTWTCRSSC